MSELAVAAVGESNKEIQIWPYVPLLSRKVPCFYSEKCSTVQRRVISSDTVSVFLFCFFAHFLLSLISPE